MNQPMPNQPPPNQHYQQPPVQPQPQPQTAPQPQGQPLHNIPAGHVRSEQAKINKDNLQQQAEQRSESQETYGLDSNKFRPINEIQNNLSALTISKKQPEYEYCWVNFRSPADTPGLAVQQKSAEVVYNVKTGYTEPVWEVVSGDMPEAQERKGVDSLRKLGDVLLMRAHKDRYAALLQGRELKRERLLQSDQAKLMDLGEQARRKGIGVMVHSDLSQSRPDLMNAKTMGGSQGIAPSMDTIERQIKNGGLPGAEVETWAGK